MSEILAILVALKKSVSDWILKTFSLIFILVTFVTGMILTIFQYRYVAPLEQSDIALLVGANTALCLIVGYSIRFLWMRFKNKE